MPPQPPRDPIQVTVIDAPACHLCTDAHQALAELADRYPIEVTNLSITSQAGADLMRRHRAAMSPLVLVDGEFFSNGRLPRRKLLKLLDHRAGGRSGDPSGLVG